jgi:hypothetical protein
MKKSSKRFNIELAKKSTYNKLLLYRDARQRKLRSVITEIYTDLYQPDNSSTKLARNANAERRVRLILNPKTEESSLFESSLTVDASTQTHPEPSARKQLTFDCFNEKGDSLCNKDLEGKLKFITAFFDYLKMYFKSAEAATNTEQTEKYKLLIERNCAFLSGNFDVFNSPKKKDREQKISNCEI